MIRCLVASGLLSLVSRMLSSFNTDLSVAHNILNNMTTRVASSLFFPPSAMRWAMNITITIIIIIIIITITITITIIASCYNVSHETR